MEENNEVTESQQNQSEPKSIRKGPFATEAVDPIVFVQTNDNPELRLAANKIPYFTNIEVNTPAPVKPKRRSYTEWIPGFKPEHSETNSAETNGNSFWRILAGIIIFAIPISIIILIVKIGLSLYK